MKKRKEYLPFSLPTIGEREIVEVVDSLKSGWITTGPKVRRFEQNFAELKKVRHAIALNSCTAALHMGLHALSLPEGSEVITTVNTFAATANVIVQTGCRPVLCDIEHDTMNLSIPDLKRKITSRTRAVIPVHLAGHPIDLDPIRSLCDRHKLHLIQDAAHAVDSLYRDKLLEEYGDMVCYSFYATKAITTAEGGMLTTGQDELAEKIRINALHGMSKDAWKRYQKGGSYAYDIVTPGFKYNLTDIQASLGLVQLSRMPEFLEARRTLANAYHNAFSDLSDFLEVPTERNYAFHAFHLYIIRLKLDHLNCSRDQFIEHLSKLNIGTSVHFIPLHLHSYYKNTYNLKPEDFPVATSVFQSMLSIPLYPKMDLEDVLYVAEAVRDGINKFKK
ncbi:MAG: DegT/DnrJ/EryC1/StrS family aminotransferase [Candidatus Wallbacteria bacterium]|nr:DegT/DnrJ/EryC1/StrS family aminotransferase [Candidatus Wallbacteria bacterium]